MGNDRHLTKCKRYLDVEIRSYMCKKVHVHESSDCENEIYRLCVKFY